MLALSLATGCGDDAATNGTAPGPSGGAGGANGAASGSSASGAGGGRLAHLLIAEIVVGPDTSEHVEIWNPGDEPVPLHRYYLSDNAGYWALPGGTPWPDGPPAGDFLVRFPDGAELDADERVAVQLGTDFEQSYGGCPDFVVGIASCGASGAVQPMATPNGGGIGPGLGNLLRDAGEMLVLFAWDGETGAVLDVDYVTWGARWDASTRADKTGVAGYAPDTPRAEQRAAPRPPDHQAIVRCDGTESGEKDPGGNGLDGHDETSEALDRSFRVAPSPSPGLPNRCN